MRRTLTAAAVLAAFALGGVAQAQNSPAAQQVVERARAASGGAKAWNALRGLHEVGEEGGAAYERWLDPLRYGMRVETPGPAAGEKLVQGYNGAAEWRILSGGIKTGSDQGEMAARVRTEAFFASYGYFFPSRFDLRGSLLGVRQSQGRSYDVVSIQPAGGVPRELWFDRSNGLLGLMVEPPMGGLPARTTEFSDYRRVAGVLAPHKLTILGGPQRVVRTLKHVDARPAERDRFSLPPPKTATP